jgi:hypothetical protein
MREQAGSKSSFDPFFWFESLGNAWNRPEIGLNLWFRGTELISSEFIFQSMAPLVDVFIFLARITAN